MKKVFLLIRQSEFLQKEGAPSDKIVIGAAFLYTRGWHEVESPGITKSLPGLFQSAKASNQDADQTPSYGAKNKNDLVSEMVVELAASGLIGISLI